MRRVHLSTLGKMGDNTDHSLNGKKSAIVYSLIFFYNKTMQRKNSNFEEFEATSLYCPRCKAAVPVRKKLLLVLPEGDEYEYLCVYCSSSVGMKLDKNAPSTDLILKP
jgi:hypothetical protein